MQTVVLLLPWVLVVAGGWLVWQLIAQNGRILLRLETIEGQLARIVPQDDDPPALPMGSPAPEFELPGLDGATHSLKEYLGRKLLLVFFEPYCDFCLDLAPELARLPDGAPRLVIISGGTVEQNREMAADAGLNCQFLSQKPGDVSTRYIITGTPSGYLIDESGKIASPRVSGREPILTLAGITPTPSDQLPSAAQRAWNLTKALADFTVDGFQTVSVDDYRKRLEICDGCDRRRGSRCLECGCYLKLKAKGRAFQCPLNRWPALEGAAKT